MLEKQIPPHPEPTWIHTFFFALNLTIQETILKQQSLFDTWNKLQKLAVELEAFKVKKMKRMGRNGTDNIPFDKSKIQGQTHNYRVKKAEQRHTMQNSGQTLNT